MLPMITTINFDYYYWLSNNHFYVSFDLYLVSDFLFNLTFLAKIHKSSLLWWSGVFSNIMQECDDRTEFNFDLNFSSNYFRQFHILYVRNSQVKNVDKKLLRWWLRCGQQRTAGMWRSHGRKEPQQPLPPLPPSAMIWNIENYQFRGPLGHQLGLDFWLCASGWAILVLFFLL